MKKNETVYVLGIDSAPKWIIETLYKKYEMDGFKAFLKAGILVDLRSTLPPVTPTAWPTIYSGLSPNIHGSIDFSYLDTNYIKQLTYYNSSKFIPFWDILSDKGYKSLIVYPPVVLQKSTHKNVDMITGWPLPPRYTSKDLEDASKRFNFNGESNTAVGLDNGSVSLEKGAKEYLSSLKNLVRFSKYLIGHKNYNLVFVGFKETDELQHFCLNTKNWEEYITPLYEEISNFIDWIIKRSKDKKENAIIILVSDHGAQPVNSKFLINSWLVETGYAKIKNAKTKNNKESISKNANRYLSKKLMEIKIRRKIYEKLPPSMKDFATRFVSNSSDKDYVKIFETDFDMQKTKAFGAITIGPVGMIFLNDKRFSKPGVSESSKNRLKKDIIKGLNKLKTPDGKKLVMHVYEGKKYYKDTKNIIPPDIMFEVTNSYIVDYSYYSLEKLLFMKPKTSRNGDHTMKGIFGVLGINEKVNYNKIMHDIKSVEDIKPFIIKLFDNKDQKY